jgi:transposase
MLKRQELLVFFANYPNSLIGIKACGSSHYWARELIKLGHDAKLLNARHVKAFVKGNKNDFNDAELFLMLSQGRMYGRSRLRP